MAGSCPNEWRTLWGKKEIVRYEQFCPFPIVFSKDLHSRHVKSGLV